ncbi:unnamed protein product [Timema podura]|uniref:Uncharacterized protein n=1 Tax=Timema podura TaxID=61482 RepID=A0ABN7P4L8_TIMPD|nr:unnamed protein product [Timema podura]
MELACLIECRDQRAAADNWKNATSIYDFTVKDIKGEDVSLEKYR